MIKIASLFRHPIKGVGREMILTSDLIKGKTMPHDRLWAVMHDSSKFDINAPEWVRCMNFIRGASSPKLQAVELISDGGIYTLSHPDCAPFAFDPADKSQHAGFIDWVAKLVSETRPKPVALVQAPDRGMTDSSFASVSIMNTASLNDLSEKIGQPVLAQRFRGNIWLDGMAPWQEHDWIGKTIRIGTAELKIRKRIERCMATTVNTKTGARDIDMLDQLEAHYGHTDFGINAEVTKSGRINTNDKAELI